MSTALLHRRFESLGFESTSKRAHRRPTRYSDGSFELELDADWAVLRAAVEHAEDVDDLHLLGRPGLWRILESDTGPTWTLELPAFVMAEEPEPELDGSPAVDPLEACIAWARASLVGELPAGWITPDREELEAWGKSSALTVRSGSHSSQGTLVREPRRLALRHAALAQVPADLSIARTQWLEACLRDGMRSWRTVRLGFTPEGNVGCEVDLSGVPHALLESFVQLALDALQLVTRWCLSSIALVTDPGVPSRALESLPVPRLT